jgi:REP element-mobilizing transposase RayT
MRSPDAIQSQLLTILAIGVRNIRFYCESRRYELCGAEANHIHNIPELIEDFSADKLAHYLEVEVAQYLRDLSDKPTGDLRAPWDVLRRWLTEYRSSPTDF